MRKPSPKKDAMHRASAESDPKAEAVKAKPKSATAKPVEREPSIASSEAESHTRSR